MFAGHLSNDDFFIRLAELLDGLRKKDHGSLFLTQKRVTHDEGLDDPLETTMATNSFPDLKLSRPLPIIIRATNGKSKERKPQKIKLSTIVEEDALDAFFIKYAEACKLGMSGLKKRDRSKGKKKMKAKKRKGVAAASGTDEARKL